MTFDDNLEDIAVSEFVLEDTSKSDEDIKEVEDASEDITSGESLHDGDIIDGVALDTTPPKIDKDVADMVDDSEEDPVKAINRSTGEDPTDADYQEKYPELHAVDPYNPDDGDDINEDDLVQAIDESCLDSFTIEAILEGLYENDEESIG